MLQKYRECHICHMDSKLSSIVIFMGKAHGLELPLEKFVQFGRISLHPTAQFPASMGSRGSRHLATWPWLHPEHVKLDIHDDIM